MTSYTSEALIPDSKDKIIEHVRAGWSRLGRTPILAMEDLSPGVSTNHVFRLTMEDGSELYAKWSRFGKFEHFVEDHEIIQAMHGALPAGYTNFLCRSYSVDGAPYIYPSQEGHRDSWVAYYYPVDTDQMLPKRQSPQAIEALGRELARFHRACTQIITQLPSSSKTTASDVGVLLEYVTQGSAIDEDVRALVEEQCLQFLEFNSSISDDFILNIPVMVDWNIGNFSVTRDYRFFSRWDYDWFRMSSRMMDFYFFARVVSDAGDRSKFTYEIDVLQEERFLLFVRSYHQEFPLCDTDLQLIPELYRFFLLNYVIKFGNAFFRDFFAQKLKVDAFRTHFESIDSFDWRRLKDALV